MKLECRGCTAKALALGRTDSIGYVSDKTGFTWIPSVGGDAIWLCKMCAERLLELAQGIVDLVGDLYAYPPTLLEMLKRSVAKDTKR